MTVLYLLGAVVLFFVACPFVLGVIEGIRQSKASKWHVISDDGEEFPVQERSKDDDVFRL